MLAAGKGHVEVVRALLKCRANTQLREKVLLVLQGDGLADSCPCW